MAGFLPAKMKRKDLDEVYDEFSEFSLSSPARKMRRLNAELPSVMEDDLPTAMPCSQQLPKEQLIASTSGLPDLEPVATEAMPPCSSNEERALVLYRPTENPLILSPYEPNISFRVSSDLIRGLKNHVFKPGDQSTVKLDEKNAVSNYSLAVVPWVQSQANFTASVFYGTGSKVEPMEGEEAEAAPMEIEDGEQAADAEIGGESFHWQQHCMTPELLPKTSSSLMWSW